MMKNPNGVSSPVLITGAGLSGKCDLPSRGTFSQSHARDPDGKSEKCPPPPSASSVTGECAHLHEISIWQAGPSREEVGERREERPFEEKLTSPPEVEKFELTSEERGKKGPNKPLLPLLFFPLASFCALNIRKAIILKKERGGRGNPSRSFCACEAMINDGGGGERGVPMKAGVFSTPEPKVKEYLYLHSGLLCNRRDSSLLLAYWSFGGTLRSRRAR